MSPEGLVGLCLFPWFTMEGASLFQMSLMGEIEIQVSLRLFQAALFPVLGLEWERGLNPQLCFFSTSSWGVGVVSEAKALWGKTEA